MSLYDFRHIPQKKVIICWKESLSVFRSRHSSRSIEQAGPLIQSIHFYFHSLNLSAILHISIFTYREVQLCYGSKIVLFLKIIFRLIDLQFCQLNRLFSFCLFGIIQRFFEIQMCLLIIFQFGMTVGNQLQSLYIALILCRISVRIFIYLSLLSW